MADAVTTKVIINDKSEHRIRMTNISDATGESAIVKIDKSTLTGLDGVTEPTAMDLKWIRWAVQGFASVRLFWDHTTDDTCMVLSGNGYDDFDGDLNRDPVSAGGTGDVILTTNGAVSGATYDITASFVKRA